MNSTTSGEMKTPREWIHVHLQSPQSQLNIIYASDIVHERVYFIMIFSRLAIENSDEKLKGTLMPLGKKCPK